MKKSNVRRHYGLYIVGISILVLMLMVTIKIFAVSKVEAGNGWLNVLQNSLSNPPYHHDLYENENDPWMGSLNPDVTMVYFTDFNCPYCKQIEPSLTQLMAEFPDLKIIIKMVPLQGQSSIMAVQFAQTVWLNEPEKFSALKKLLMASPRTLDAATIIKVAKLTKTEQWLAHTDNRVDMMIQTNIELMRNLRLNGTPSLIMGETIIPGLVPYNILKEQLERVIETQG